MEYPQVKETLTPGWYWVNNPRYGTPWSIKYLGEDDCRYWNKPLLTECVNTRRAEVRGPIQAPK